MACRIVAVHQKSIGIAGNIGEISIHHRHLIPHLAISQRLFQPFLFGLVNKVTDGSLFVIVIIWH